MESVTGMPIVLFDTLQRNLMVPFTYTRAMAGIRCGLFTMQERWQQLTGEQVYVLTAPYLQPLYPAIPPGKMIWINAAIIPDTRLVNCIFNLQENEALVKEGNVIAGVTSVITQWDSIQLLAENFLKHIPYDSSIHQLTYPWHIFQWNDQLIRSDIALHTPVLPLPAHLKQPGWIAPENIFIEEGALVAPCFINASEGPVFIAKRAVVMEGCMIRGPFVMGEGSVLKMGTKIYGATSLGPYCMAGGEIKNAVLMGYSNKAHDGYLGDAVLGEWCNLGAGTSNSNIRNDASDVVLHSVPFSKTKVGLKCGLLMGDYSRSAINTSFNTGTFVGISSNIFGQGLTPGYLPNYTWGYSQRYIFEKAVEHIANWKNLKQQELKPEEVRVLENLYKQTIL